jgi:hypothetical protein
LVIGAWSFVGHWDLGLDHFRFMPIRIAILGGSPCDLCTAACCKQSGHEFAVRLRGDEVRRFAPWAIDVPIARKDGSVGHERVLPYVDGRCPFLGADDRCTIYADRPQSCREFECVTAYNSDGPGQHGRFLQLNPHVLHILKSL